MKSVTEKNFSILLAAARRREQWAIDGLWERVKAKPLAIARKRSVKRYLGPDGENELAEPFAYALKNKHLVEEEDFVRYLCKASKIRMNNLLAQNYRQHMAEVSLEETTVAELGYEEDFRQALLWDEVRPLLTEKEYFAFVLAVRDDLQVREIARRMKCGRQHVWSLLSSAKKKLREYYK